MDEESFIADIREQKREAREFIDGVMDSFTGGLTDEELAKRRTECDREGHKEPLIPENSVFFQSNRYPTIRRNFCKYCGRDYEVFVPAISDDSILYRRVTI